MNRLWSPWRMQYVVGEKPEGCVFCRAPQEDQDTENLILLRGRHCYVMMNRYPYNNGHLMIIPYAHVDSPLKMNPDELMELMQLVNVCLEVLQEAAHPDGFNIGMNLGAAAGAGIKDHVHMHIVPRWMGDTNFMPVLGETRVIIEALEQSYAKLKPLFECRCEPFRSKPDPLERPA